MITGAVLHIITDGLIQRFIEWIIHNGGLYVLLFFIFAETGLLVGFFLPGDSLLFAAGIYSDELAREFFNLHYGIVIGLVIMASIIGSAVGYLIGYKTGPLMFHRKESLLFKPKYLLKAKGFYEKYGKATVFFSKFLPIVRTFAPVVAGITKMKKNTFMLYNLVGSICWVCIMMLAGHFLQSAIEKKYGYSLKEHIETITIVIVLVTTLPVLLKLLFSKKQKVSRVEVDTG
jgi:membrane-associated protein